MTACISTGLIVGLNLGLVVDVGLAVGLSIEMADKGLEPPMDCSVEVASSSVFFAKQSMPPKQVCPAGQGWLLEQAVSGLHRSMAVVQA